MAAIHDSLARANGWGSAGQCPATHAAKTPAVRESVSRVAAVAGAAATASAATHPADGTAHLLEQLAELRAVARTYYAHSDLTRLTRDGAEAADRLAKLLGYPGDAV
jgi:hypothetical protein